MLLAELAEVSRAVAATRARLVKIETLAGALRSAETGEVPIAVAYLSGELPQRHASIVSLASGLSSGIPLPGSRQIPPRHQGKRLSGLLLRGMAGLAREADWIT